MDDSASSPAVFVSRDRCICCGSVELREIGGGSFCDEPLHSFIANDPWGENPMAVLRNHSWSLVRCRECSQAFHRFILSPEWNQVRFTRWMSEDAIRRFEDEHGGNQDPTRDVQHVLRLKDLGVKRLLDFGCGFGEFLEMCRLFGIQAHGVDRSNARRSGAGVQIHAELDDVPGTFDAITMFEVLEHVDDPLGLLAALRKRLNPGGLMVVEVPDTSGVSGIRDRGTYCKIHPLDHINAFTPQSLICIMAQAGFKPIGKGPAFVTTSLKRVAKDLAKASLKQSSTQRYFQLRS